MNTSKSRPTKPQGQQGLMSLTYHGWALSRHWWARGVPILEGRQLLASAVLRNGCVQLDGRITSLVCAAVPKCKNGTDNGEDHGPGALE